MWFFSNIFCNRFCVWCPEQPRRSWARASRRAERSSQAQDPGRWLEGGRRDAEEWEDCFETATWLMMGVTRKEENIKRARQEMRFYCEDGICTSNTSCRLLTETRVCQAPESQGKLPFHRWKTQQGNSHIPKCQVTPATQMWGSFPGVTLKIIVFH